MLNVQEKQVMHRTLPQALQDIYLQEKVSSCN